MGIEWRAGCDSRVIAKGEKRADGLELVDGAVLNRGKHHRDLLEEPDRHLSISLTLPTDPSS